MKLWMAKDKKPVTSQVVSSAALSTTSSFEAHRAYQTIARISVLALIGLTLVVIVEGALLMTLWPLKEIQPVLITLKDKGEQVVHIEPLERSVKGLQQLTEAMCRKYIKLRETFDLHTENVRWQEVAYMSSDLLAKAFQAQVAPDTKSGVLYQRTQDRTRREVKILSSASLAPQAPDMYQVEWQSEDFQDGQSLGVKTWQSTLTVSLESRSMREVDQYINPTGFTVTHYTVGRKN